MTNITPERALEILAECDHSKIVTNPYTYLYQFTEKQLVRLMDAVITDEFGEPVGGICLKNSNDYPMATFTTTDLSVGTILYARKDGK